MAPLAAQQLQEILGANFAPWVQDLGLRVESLGSDSALLRLPFSERLVRVGGVVCGQALMAAADTACVLALAASFGEFRPVATVAQNISLLRPVTNDDLLVEAHVQVAFISAGRARPIPKPLRIAMQADQEAGGGA